MGLTRIRHDRFYWTYLAKCYVYKETPRLEDTWILWKHFIYIWSQRLLDLPSALLFSLTILKNAFEIGLDTNKASSVPEKVNNETLQASTFIYDGIKTRAFECHAHCIHLHPFSRWTRINDIIENTFHFRHIFASGFHIFDYWLNLILATNKVVHLQRKNQY